MEGGEPPAKMKRGSDRQITQDDPESGDEDNEPKGPWAKASADVIAQRRVISVKRKPREAAPAGASNPFAGVSLFGSIAKPAAPAEEKKDGGDTEGKPAAEGYKPAAAASPAPLFGGSFASAATKNPFAFAAAASGTASGFASFAAKTSSPGGDGDSAAAEHKGKDGSKGAEDKAADGGAGAGGDGGGSGGSGFTFSQPGASGSSIFPPVSSVFGSGAAAASGMFGGGDPPAAIGASRPAPAAVLSEEKQVTGEEEEAVDFAAESTLFEFDDNKAWRERGKGEIRINLANSGQARFVMRQRGNYRLLLNANVWPGINVAAMDGGKGVTFAVVNCAAAAGEEGASPSPNKEAAAAEGEEGAHDSKLSTYAVRFKVKEHVAEFTAAVERCKAGGTPGDNTEPAAAAGEEAV